MALTCLLALLGIPAHAQDFPPTIDLNTLEPTGGFEIEGDVPTEGFGESVDPIGDINNDGIDDLVIGAPELFGAMQPGRAYVVFGRDGGFPAFWQSDELDGTNGFVIDGEEGDDLAGFSVSAAGDLNGDGLADLVIGAAEADPNGSSSGRAYVLFGSRSPFEPLVDLGRLDGTNGFAVSGEAAFDRAGGAVAGVGDFNGDGIDDLGIGATGLDLNGDQSGAVYVLFGSDRGWPSVVELADLDGRNGIVLVGAVAGDLAGRSVDGAGDVNGDGIDDLVLGADSATPNGDPTRDGAGRGYLVFGTQRAFPDRRVDLDDLDGTAGVAFDGEDFEDSAGRSAAGIGDVNNDGFDDFAFGAPFVDVGGNNAGRVYVVFGTDAPWPASIELADLGGTTGFLLDGVDPTGIAGFSVAGAGDLDQDGIDDLVVGASGTGDNSGTAYVVFGSTTPFPAPRSLGSLDGSNGFSLTGDDPGAFAGRSVAGGGDLDHDGIADLVIGAPALVGPDPTQPGSTYVIFGGDPGLLFRDGFED
jgi:hypothetical protein